MRKTRKDYSQNNTSQRKNTLTSTKSKIIQVPAKSQSRHLKSPSSTMKTTTSSIHKNQEKNVSHIRHLRISQTRHLKTYSLISRPPEEISQSRRLHHFPHSAPPVSRTRHLTSPVLVTFQLLYIIIKNRIYDNTLSQNF